MSLFKKLLKKESMKDTTDLIRGERRVFVNFELDLPLC